MPNELPEVGDRVTFLDTMREGDYLTCVQILTGGRLYRREDRSHIDLSDHAVLNSPDYKLLKTFRGPFPTRFDRDDPI